ncbi:uncharacterized protein LOC123317202 [Coccinella septempunctata]|uniref:uncharacterized protein LOC123317178 n=1 Tax=Coccinella septempunctata TaxID=41139 RepID=UPI001D078852|nr:uncharacterized protein LOC123317178 [Coccinella septempunctata]XP_044759548.1 uncharacterized protein LOC123317202 [Coccinella septempunctata]
MGFYAEVQQTYGRETANNLKSWSSYNLKLASYRNRRVFLLECKRLGLMPKHLSSNMNYLFGSAADAVSSRQVQTMRDRSLRLALQFEIKVTVARIGRMENEMSRLWQILEDFLPSEVLSRYGLCQSRRYRKRFAVIRERNLRKVRALSEEQLKRVKPQQRWVKNISSTILPDRVLNFLALGPKFSIDVPKGEISMSRLLADIENIINLNGTLSDEGKNIKRFQASNIVTNYMKKNKRTSNNIYQREFYYCRNYLKEHPEILVTQSDKGNITVIMDRAQYIELSNTILHDERYYKTLARDPTTTIQNKCNALIRELVNEGHLTQSQGKRLYFYNAVPAKFYGLPKVHKPTLSLRPIISSINTPTSKLSTYISDILTRYLSTTRGRYYVRDTFSFAESVSDLQLPNDYVLISLDVVSLFSNIPVQLAVSAIEKRWDEIKLHTSIPKDRFIAIVRFLFSSCYFVFGGDFYMQILGSPMGSDLSQPIAEIIMDFLLDCILAGIPFEIPLIKRFVDDLLCAVPKDQVAYTLERFNEQHQSIQFTLEEETNGGVPFLDTMVMRTPENRIILDWYRKPTSSGRYLNYFSNHSHRQKLMVENGYPKGLLARLIFNTALTPRPQSMGDNPHTVDNPASLTFATIPLINNMSYDLINLLKTSTLRIVPKNEFKIEKLFSRKKDRLDVGNTMGVVYSIPCSECMEVYIGQTSQQLKRRIAQHRSDIKNPNKACALADHTRNKNHLMDYQSAKVLESETNGDKRRFMEMYHIKRQENSMNYRRDVNNISNVYSYLIHLDQLSESELRGTQNMMDSIAVSEIT